MNSNWFKLVMKMTKIEYGKNLLLKGVPIIFNKGGAKLKIGENTTIKSSFLSNLVGLYSRTIIVTRAPGAEIEIGDNVGISGATIYARKKITIGENTCIGGNCKILDNDFHPIETETRNKLLRDENGGDSDLVPSREIKIGKNCFIGCNSIILKGTVLGDGCVVGAGAVVCGKFEDNCVIAGNPAKDGVNGIVIFNEQNKKMIYKEMLYISVTDLKAICNNNRIICQSHFSEKNYLGKMKEIYNKW